MRRALLITILVALSWSGCAPTSSDTDGSAGLYERPDIPRLLAEARRLEPTDETPEDHARWIDLWAEFSAYGAVWEAVARAEKLGLRELYGVEMFRSGDFDYEALFFLRTTGDTSCIYAKGTLHEKRPDPGTVPALDVTAAVLDKLRARVGAELPFRVTADLTSQVMDGATFVVHVFRDRGSHAALWYEPQTFFERTREGVREHADARPVLTVIGALWAAAPQELFPVDWYRDDLPEDRLWESDPQEVYDRAPGYD